MAIKKNKPELPLVGSNDFTGMPDETNKKGSFKKSGHLADQMLKHEYPLNGQLNLFDVLKDVTKKEIEGNKIEKSQIVEGVKLTPSETKIIDSLCKLLHQNSQVVDPKKEDYYTGNLIAEKIDYIGEVTSVPKLGVSLYELAKEYKGGNSISGKDVDNVKSILADLNNKKFLIRYTEKTKDNKQRWVKKEYEAYRKLIEVDKATLSYGEGDIEHYKKTETVILLHPIFRRQIDSKFITYPNDITKRTVIAYGSHNVSDVTIRLRDYLMRELSSNRYEPEIGMKKLYYQLAEKWMKESRKAKVKSYTDKAIETMVNLGLIKSYETKTSKISGDLKIVFILNKDFV